MINNMKFSAINTKIGAMVSQMLDEKDFHNIMSLGSVQEVYDYLNDNTVMREVLWHLQGKKIHRNDVEKALYRYRVMVMEKIMLYLGGEYKDFLKKYMLRYEIEDIKLILEVVRGRFTPENIKDHLFSSSRYSTIDFDELIQQDSVLQVVEKLKGTKYHRLILPYISKISEKFNFYIEMILDKYYYHELIKAAQKLPKAENRKSTELLRRNIDLLNLEWIYRATKYFDMSKEEILNFVLDYGYKYDYHKLKDLIYSFDLTKLQSHFANSQYAFLFNHDHDIDMYMERRIERYTYYKGLSLYRTSILDFGKVVAYIQLLEFEVKDIISVIESKRYNLKAKEISKYLIRTIEVVD